MDLTYVADSEWPGWRPIDLLHASCSHDLELVPFCFRPFGIRSAINWPSDGVLHPTGIRGLSLLVRGGKGGYGQVSAFDQPPDCTLEASRFKRWSFGECLTLVYYT
jgi:hypothetical protein